MTTGHDKAVQLVADLFDEWLHRMHGVTSSCDHHVEAAEILAALRAALAAGDADVAEALGLKPKYDGEKPGSIHNRCHVRFVTDWTEA